MHASTKPLSQEEMKTVADGVPLTIDRVVIHGHYENGVAFIREESVGAELLPDQRVLAGMVFAYPDPLEEAANGVMQ